MSAVYSTIRKGISIIESTVRKVANNFGYQLVRRHYYSPIPDAADFPPGYWEQQSALVGLDMNEKYKETSLGGLAVNVVEC